MFEGGAAVLQMKKVFLKTGKYDRKKYMTHIKGYDKKEEEMTFIVGKGEAAAFSLDAVYECIFEAAEGRFGCEGVVKKRFADRNGEQIVFRVENGFYTV